MTTQDLDQRRRRFTSTVLDQVAKDAQFRQQLIDDPKSALDARGLWAEYDAILQEYQRADVEVEGYAATPDASSCGRCGASSY